MKRLTFQNESFLRFKNPATEIEPRTLYQLRP